MYKGQRWMSETEPELGLGTITHSDNPVYRHYFFHEKNKQKIFRCRGAAQAGRV